MESVRVPRPLGSNICHRNFAEFHMLCTDFFYKFLVLYKDEVYLSKNKNTTSQPVDARYLLSESWYFYFSLYIWFWKFKLAGLSTLVGLLKHDDEAIIGNAALCLSHLTDLPKVPGKLTKTNIIQVSVQICLKYLENSLKPMSYR